MKKRILFITLLVAVTLISCNSTFISIEGNGDKVTEEYSVKDFSYLDASNAFNVSVAVGSENNVKIIADKNLLKYVKVYEKNSTLHLKLANSTNITGEIKAIISTQELKGVDLSGACKIKVMDINSKNFSIDMSGACKGKFEGTTENLSIDISGATKINTSELISSSVTLDVSGASKCSVYSSNSLIIDASGASKIDVYGNPPILKSDVSGMSSINSK